MDIDCISLFLQLYICHILHYPNYDLRSEALLPNIINIKMKALVGIKRVVDYTAQKIKVKNG